MCKQSFSIEIYFDSLFECACTHKQTNFSWESAAQWFHQIASNADPDTHARLERHHTRCSLRKLSGPMHFTDIASSIARQKARIDIIERYNQRNRSLATPKRRRGMWFAFVFDSNPIFDSNPLNCTTTEKKQNSLQPMENSLIELNWFHFIYRFDECKISSFKCRKNSKQTQYWRWTRKTIVLLMFSVLLFSFFYCILYLCFVVLVPFRFVFTHSNCSTSSSYMHCESSACTRKRQRHQF